MAISMTLQESLEKQGVNFALEHHRHTYNSASTAEAAHVSGADLAKGVLVDDGMGYLLAVIPSTHRLNLEMLRQTLHRPVELATEGELQDLFPDCETGAVPPLGSAFGLETVVDQNLMERPDIWFEAGDHEDLVHISGASFRTLMGSATRGKISSQR
jgi:Ala-tRNA(Pro) deacylase